MARFFSIVLLILTFLMSQVDARVLSGSRTERKMNRKIERLLKSARKHYDGGKVQQALDTYWKILEIDPQETFAYLELGEIYYHLRIYDRSIELLEPGCQTAELEMDPETVCHYYCLLTQAYVEIKQLGKASKSLIKAAEASPKNPLPRKILGDIYLANNRIKSAYKAYKKALSFDPNYQPALEKIGELTTKYNIQVVKVPVKPASDNKKTVSKKTQPQNSDDNQEESGEEPEAIEESEETEENIADARPTPMAKTTPVTKPSDDLIPVAIIPMPAAGTQNSNKTEPVKSNSGKSEKPVNAESKSASPASKPAASAAKSASEKENKTEPAVDRDTIEEQLDKLLAGSVEQKKEATEFFVAMKADGIVEVEELLYDSDPEVRMVAIRALAAFKNHKERITNILNDSLDDPDPEVQKEIQGALSSLK